MRGCVGVGVGVCVRVCARIIGSDEMSYELVMGSEELMIGSNEMSYELVMGSDEMSYEFVMGSDEMSYGARDGHEQDVAHHGLNRLPTVPVRRTTRQLMKCDQDSYEGSDAANEP